MSLRLRRSRAVVKAPPTLDRWLARVHSCHASGYLDLRRRARTAGLRPCVRGAVGSRHGRSELYRLAPRRPFGGARRRRRRRGRLQQRKARAPGIAERRSDHRARPGGSRRHARAATPVRIRLPPGRRPRRPWLHRGFPRPDPRQSGDRQCGLRGLPLRRHEADRLRELGLCLSHGATGLGEPLPDARRGAGRLRSAGKRFCRRGLRLVQADGGVSAGADRTARALHGFGRPDLQRLR